MPALSFLTWNVNGSKNISQVPHALKFVLGHDVIFLQETFELPGGVNFRPKGFIAFSNDAVATGGRPSGGLATLIRLDLVKGAITKLPSPEPWLLALRWSEPGQKPLILINIYVARFSSNLGLFSASTLENFLADLRSSFADHSFIVAGDFNADPYRDRPSAVERDVLNILVGLSNDGFSMFPRSRIPTFSDRGRASTIDFIVSSPDLTTSSSRVGSPFASQHHPISSTLVIPPFLTFTPPGDYFVLFYFIFLTVLSAAVLPRNTVNIYLSFSFCFVYSYFYIFSRT